MFRYAWIILVLSFWAPCLFSQNNLNVPVSVAYDQVPVSKALAQIEQVSQIPFSYTPNTLPDTLVSGNYESVPLRKVLEQLLNPLGLGFKLRYGVLVLGPMEAKTNLRLFTVSGYVEDRSSGERLIGATVYDARTRKGTITNEFGFFSLRLPADSMKLVVSMVGYAVYAEQFQLTKNTRGKIQLIPDLSLETVEIVDYQGISIGQMGGVNGLHIPASELNKLPTLLGESDVLAALKLLPGINVGSEGASGLYVRGGGPDQNLVLMDGVPIYNSSHVFGFFSIFNSNTIKDVELFKSGFPARYGGRLSSVINIRMKEGDFSRFRAEGSLGLTSASLLFEGPILKNRLSFVLSARRTLMEPYFKVVNRFAEAEDGNFLGYFFYDLNGKLNWRMGPRDELSLTMYSGRDVLESGYEIQANAVRDLFDFDLSWGNQAGILAWRRDWSPRFFSEVSAYGTQYRYNSVSTTELDYLGQSFERHELNNVSSVQDVGARLNLEWVPRQQHHVRMGGAVIRHVFQPEVFQFSAISVGIDTVYDRASQPMLKPFEANLYFEDQVQAGKLLSFNLGLHSSYFQLDSTRFISIQPRVSFRLGKPGRSGIYGGFSTMAQNLHLLSNSGVGLPTDLWVPATDRIVPEQSMQWYFGMDKSFSGPGLQIGLEGYFKDMKNLIDYQTGTNFLGDVNWQDRVEKEGIGKSYGLEVFLRKTTGRIRGWLGYTWAKTDRQFPSINFGNVFPYKYDRRHDFSAVMIFEVNDKIELSANWVYGTGTANTFPEAVFYSPSNSALDFWSLNEGEEVNVVIDYSERNSFRLPAYHRLDVNFKYHRPTKWGELFWNFGLYNAYNRRNPYFLFLRADYSEDPNAPQIKARKMSLLPILPSVKFGVKF